jgi:hypothetical protein
VALSVDGRRYEQEFGECMLKTLCRSLKKEQMISLKDKFDVSSTPRCKIRVGHGNDE